MFKDITQRAGLKAHIVGIEHRTEHRYREGTLECFGYVGGNEGNCVPFAHPALCQRRGETFTARRHLTPVAANAAVYLGGQVRMNPFDTL